MLARVPLIMESEENGGRRRRRRRRRRGSYGNSGRFLGVKRCGGHVQTTLWCATEVGLALARGQCRYNEGKWLQCGQNPQVAMVS